MADQWIVRPVLLSGSRNLPPRFPEATARVSYSPDAIRTATQTLLAILGGKMHVPQRVLSDLRFRLIQLHEQLHGHHRAFVHETFARMKHYLKLCIQQGLLPRGNDVKAPMLFARGEQLLSLGDAPRVLTHRDDGGTVAVCTVPQAVLAVGIVLSSRDELFADFFSLAAGGAAYWSTIADFELSGPHDDASWLTSTWHENYPHVFEPHPVSGLRLSHFPKLMGEVFCESAVVPSDGHRYRLVNSLAEHFETRVKPKLPSISENALVTYTNLDAEDDTSTISLPVSFLLPFYRAAIESLTVLLNDWWLSGHPLLHLTGFFAFDHHWRIDELAKEFAKGVPTPNNQLDAIAGAAAARLHFDRKLEANGSNCAIQQLQADAAAFLKECQRSFPSLVPIIAS